MYPLTNVYIRNNKKIVKEYGEDGTYITNTSVDGTTIALTHSKKSGNGYKKINVSYIRYKDKQEGSFRVWVYRNKIESVISCIPG